MNKNRESRRQSNPTCVCVCAQSVDGRMTWPQSGSTKCIGVAQQPVDALFKSTISRCCTRAHVSPDAPPQALTYYPGPVFSAFLFHLFFLFIYFIILCFVFLSLQLQVEIGISFAASFIQCQDAIPNLFCCFSVFFLQFLNFLWDWFRTRIARVQSVLDFFGRSWRVAVGPSLYRVLLPQHVRFMLFPCEIACIQGEEPGKAGWRPILQPRLVSAGFGILISQYLQR